MHGECEIWIFRKIAPMVAEFQPKKFFLHLNALIYWPIVTKLALFVARMWRVGCMDFQENPSNGNPDAHIT